MFAEISISRTQTVNRTAKEKCIHNTPWKIPVECSPIRPGYTTTILLQGNARYTEWNGGLIAPYTEKEDLDHIRQVFG